MTGGPARIAWATTSGSSGKTTSTVTTAAILAERGHRVLVVDGDWQMDASRWLGLDEAELPEDRRTLLDVLLDRDTITDAIAPSSVAGIDLLPSSPGLQVAARILAGTRGVEGQLRRALDTVEDAGITDWRDHLYPFETSPAGNKMALVYAGGHHNLVGGQLPAGASGPDAMRNGTDFILANAAGDAEAAARIAALQTNDVREVMRR